MANVTARMTNLFLQLGLDATEEGIAQFISKHNLAPEVSVLEADIWTEAQRQLLKELLCSDGEWSLVVDQLSEALRETTS